MSVEYPDLSAAREAIGGLMLDDFTVTRDPQGDADDTFDYTTGGLTPPVGDTSTPYAGKGKISPAGTQGRPQAQGDRPYEATDYSFSVPLEGGYEPKVGDLITCTGSVRDPFLPGKQWLVTDPVYGTFAVSRKCVCQLRLTPDGAQ